MRALAQSSGALAVACSRSGFLHLKGDWLTLSLILHISAAQDAQISRENDEEVRRRTHLFDSVVLAIRCARNLGPMKTEWTRDRHSVTRKRENAIQVGWMRPLEFRALLKLEHHWCCRLGQVVESCIGRHVMVFVNILCGKCSWAHPADNDKVTRMLTNASPFFVNALDEFVPFELGNRVARVHGERNLFGCLFIYLRRGCPIEHSDDQRGER